MLALLFAQVAFHAVGIGSNKLDLLAFREVGGLVQERRPLRFERGGTRLTVVPPPPSTHA